MITIAKMTVLPQEIAYFFTAHPIGTLFIATSDKGICHAEFQTNEQEAIVGLQQRFPNVQLNKQMDQNIDFYSETTEKKLHVFGTNFQLTVWQALCEIPSGNLISYQQLALLIERPNAVRAVASAVARNQIALFIPCHRVVRKSGEIGNYRWGKALKKQLILIENEQNAQQIQLSIS